MKKYEAVKEISTVAYDFIKNRLFVENLQDGRYELGGGVYVNIESYVTKFRKDCKFESHKKYIDIQIMLEGQELVCVCNVASLQPETNYDSQKDFVLYSNRGDGVDFLLSKNDFLIFYPKDAHMPCVCVGGQNQARKAVVKVPVKDKSLNCDVVDMDFSKIKMVLTDCDGCLTDGGMYYSENGDELKKFNARDGMGFKLLRERGIICGVITGEKRELNSRRAKKLNLDILEQGVDDKLVVVKKICHDRNIALENIAYIGDDVNDMELIKAVGFGCCPADAVDAVKVAAHYVTRAKGGRGAVREVADMVLCL